MADFVDRFWQFLWRPQQDYAEYFHKKRERVSNVAIISAEVKVAYTGARFIKISSRLNWTGISRSALSIAASASALMTGKGYRGRKRGKLYFSPEAVELAVCSLAAAGVRVTYFSMFIGPDTGG